MRKSHQIQMQMFAEEKLGVGLPRIWWLNLQNICIDHIVLCTSGHFNSLSITVLEKLFCFSVSAFRALLCTPLSFPGDLQCHFLSALSSGICIIAVTWLTFSCALLFRVFCRAVLAGWGGVVSLWTAPSKRVWVPSSLHPCHGPPQPSAGSFPPSSQPPLPGLTASYLGHLIDSLHRNLVHQSS